MKSNEISMRVKYTFHKIKYFVKCIAVNLSSDEELMKRQFKNYQDYSLDLESPKTLNQKLQWLKLNDRTPLHTICADKINVRSYIEKKLGSKENLIDLLKVYNSPFEITKESLPNSKFVIKSSHYCGDYFIVRDKNNLDLDEVKNKFIKTLNCNIYHHGREWQYKHVPRKIIVERLLEDERGRIPNDIKIHCFNGEPKFIYLSVDREGGNYRNIYDVNWNVLDFSWTRKGKDITKFNIKPMSKPELLDEALSIARKLSSEFKYLRVDLYFVNGKIYIGELTFHQGSGYDRILPHEWDEKLGELLDL
ncbi:TPA: ATP-grasp fold amidoligase family protein [Vibrio alginolyticus]